MGANRRDEGEGETSRTLDRGNGIDVEDVLHLDCGEGSPAGERGRLDLFKARYGRRELFGWLVRGY